MMPLVLEWQYCWVLKMYIPPSQPRGDLLHCIVVLRETINIWGWFYESIFPSGFSLARVCSATWLGLRLGRPLHLLGAMPGNKMQACLFRVFLCRSLPVQACRGWEPGRRRKHYTWDGVLEVPLKSLRTRNSGKGKGCWFHPKGPLCLFWVLKDGVWKSW